LTRRVLIINMAALLIPILGLLHLDQYRASLIVSELDALKVQAHAFALSLVNVAAGCAPGSSLAPESLSPTASP
jgi:two-component system sensor histidine kinase ChvG